jgi:hypothetical protein
MALTVAAGSLAFDPGGELLHIGGGDGQSLELLTAVPGAVSMGSTGGCSHANTPPRLVCHDAARIGGTLRFELLRTEPLQLSLLAWNDTAALVPVAWCRMLVAPVPLTLGFSDSFGRLEQAVVLPPDPSLVGFVLALQAATFEVRGPVFGALALSDPVIVQVGR